MKDIVVSLMCLLLFALTVKGQTSLLRGYDGVVAFVSDAPLELIKASSTELKAIVDRGTNKFAFQVDINSFQGFNNPLQRIHFQENYMETEIYPQASFEGAFIDDIDWSSFDEHSVRAKGVLIIHGVKQERIIRGKLQRSEDGVVVVSEFSVPLEDHDIRIPRIVHQKIAQEITVSLRISLK